MSYTVTVGKKPDPVRSGKKVSLHGAWQRFREPENQNVIALALVGGFLGFWLPLRYDLGLPGLIGRAKGYSGENPAWQVEADKRGPRVGQKVPALALFDFEGRKVALPHKQGLTLLAFTGNCTACATRDNMVATQKLLKQFPKMHPYIVVMSGDARAARALWQAGQVEAPLLLDRNGDMALKMNAIFTFRRYIIDPQGKLLYASRRDQDDKDVEREIEAVVRSHGQGDGE